MTANQSTDHDHRAILERIAHQAMLERGLEPDFPPAGLAQLEGIRGPAPTSGQQAVDLRALLWASIDDDDSLDLDQLTVAEPLPDGRIKIRVAVADVDALVPLGSPLDGHARTNTTSVYTPARIFSMLPEKLSTNLTSLNCGEDRLAMVIEMAVGAGGELGESSVYPGLVRSQAKLAYNGVAAWLDGEGALPPAAGAVPGLADNLHLQARAAAALKELRHQHGALSLETIEARPVFTGSALSGLEVEEKNHARELIEDFMIAANGVTARYLAEKKFASIRRVVRTPKRWDRMVEIAAGYGARLPEAPDPRALEDFLTRQKAADPLRFPDLSLAFVKLMGAGEYSAELPGQEEDGHFGLAVKDYAHSTAPNRRYTDLVTQRLLKAAWAGRPSPYRLDELQSLAEHCTRQEDAVNKVERQVTKSAAALLLEDRAGERFEALVTGASPKGTWVRLLAMPVEGRVVSGFEGLDVGDRLTVSLVGVDVAQGFIDFQRAGPARPGGAKSS